MTLYITKLYCIATKDTAGRKKAILLYLDKIRSRIQEIDDQYILDRILSLMMQADTSSRVLESNSDTKDFEKQDTFVPTQKMRYNYILKKRGNP